MTDTLARIKAERDIFESRLRIRIWNTCKAIGMKDDAACRRVTEEIDELRAKAASGIAARSDETPQVAQPEARARPDAQNKGVSHD